MRQSRPMRVSAKVDYALRAGAQLAAATSDGPQKGDHLARAQKIPLKFLENILLDLKHAGLVQSQRGAEGGYWLAKDPAEITLADVIRAGEGPIANVPGEGPETGEHAGGAAGAGGGRGGGGATAGGLDRRPRQSPRGARDGHAGRRRRRHAARRGQPDRCRPGRLAAALNVVSRLGRT